MKRNAPNKIRALQRFHFKSRRIIWAPSLRGILVALNLSLDRVIQSIDQERFDVERPLSIQEYEYISEVEWSVLLLEDRRFFIHSGVDIVRATLRLAKRICTLKGIGGVSTIEQQLVRTILDDRRRNISRKIREVIIANALSYRKTKFDILRTYLKKAYLGYRIEGVDQASFVLFRKTAMELSPDEADLVASLLVYPLPKMIMVPMIEKNLKVGEIADFLKIAHELCPRWSTRIGKRISYARLLRRDTIKPLYQIH